MESLRLYRELGNLSGIIVSLTVLARSTLWMRDFSSPVPWLEEAITISRQLGDQKIEGNALLKFGFLAYWQNDYRQAIEYYEQANLLAEKIGNGFLYRWIHIHMAYAVLRQGDIQRAREIFKTSIRDTQKADLLIGLVYALEGMASLNINQDQLECATQLFVWADATREKIGDHRPPVEQASVEKDLAIIHSQLNDDEFESLSAEGSIMTKEQAIALALEE